jgi:hypothetical protein
VTVDETTMNLGASEVVTGCVIVTGTTVVKVEDEMIGVGAGRVNVTGTTVIEVEDDVM